MDEKELERRIDKIIDYAHEDDWRWNGEDEIHERRFNEEYAKKKLLELFREIQAEAAPHSE